MHAIPARAGDDDRNEKLCDEVKLIHRHLFEFNGDLKKTQEKIPDVLCDFYTTSNSLMTTPKTLKELDVCRLSWMDQVSYPNMVIYMFYSDQWVNSSFEMKEAAIYHELVARAHLEASETCELTKKFLKEQAATWEAARFSKLNCKLSVEALSWSQKLNATEVLTLNTPKDGDLRIWMESNDIPRILKIQTKKNLREIPLSPYWFKGKGVQELQFKSEAGSLFELSCESE